MKNLKLTLSLFLGISTSMVHAQLSFTESNALLGNPGHEGEHPLAVFDMDGDKLDDIVILEDGSFPHIYFQNQPGQAFTHYALTDTLTWNNAWGMCGGDVDGNGFSDFLYGGNFDDIHLVKANATGNDYSGSDLGVFVFLQGINFADIDADGNLDVFACHDVGASVVLLGDGNGNFTMDTTHINTNLPNGSDNSGNYGSVFTDFDNDGDIDLYIAKCRQGVSNPLDPRRINVLFVNDGNGVYTEDADSRGIASGEQSWSADFADVDNDGDMDLFIGQHSSTSELFINDGTGSFVDASASSGLDQINVSYVIQSVFEDFDNDGWVDLLVSGANTHQFCMNNGDGTFDLTVSDNIGMGVNSFALGDLNDDGFVDLSATPHGYGGWGASGKDSIYLNDGNSNNHLMVYLTGTASNLEGIGARVEIHGPWGVQVREIHSGQSYGIQNSLNAHFGLGSETMADSVIVKWPSGIVDTFYDVDANSKLSVKEGEGLGVEELSDLKFKIQPNPVSDQLLVHLPQNNDVEVLQLTAANGQLVREIVVNNLHPLIEVSDLRAGTYQLTALSAGQVRGTQTVIITH